MYNDPANIITLIEGCKINDPKAQEQLYRCYYKSMINLCLRYSKNEQDAMDVLNAAFLKVFRNIQQYNSAKGILYTWIRTIVINTCIDKMQLQRQQIITGELKQDEDVFVDPEALIKADVASILQLVRMLPPATKAVFNLYSIEGYGHKEIGKMLKITEGTSKWHLSEARKKLQQLLKQQANN